MSIMAERFDTSDATAREEGFGAAVTAVRRGELVVLPTDTVYGVGADAFSPAAVARLLEAKGRSREMPPPVLVASTDGLRALTTSVPRWVFDLTDRYWPGPLTLVCHQQPSLRWDLGETRGTVAVRMPDHDVALQLIGRTGPLAVSSANLTGNPAATDADSAADMLGERVSVILDAGTTVPPDASDSPPSTILDCTGDVPRVLREGALAVDELDEFLADLGVRIAQGERESKREEDTGSGA